jgi:Flp pilus assembly protein TadG
MLGHDKMKTAKNTRVSRGQKGATLVEGALVLLTIISMMVFVMDMGRILLTQQWVSERARTTVRSAVVNNWSSAQAANFLCYNSTDAPNGDATTPGYLGLLPSQVSLNTLGTSTASDYRLQIVVSGIPIWTWVPFITGNYTAPTVTATYPAQSLGATS